MEHDGVRAVSLHVTGIVQGVGFRPFVYALARRLGLTGWVKNTTDGVFILAEGTDDALGALAGALRAEAPPMAVVTSVIAEDVEYEGHDAFTIAASETVEGAMTLVSPDIATCDACAAEVRDESDRRYGYPFTNCTNCGPRFTIIADVPYDRPMTTMRDFPLCETCAAEYADPADRRFHAQPNACFRCGPRLYLQAGGTPDDWRWTPECESVPRPHRDPDAERERASAIIAEAVRLLREGTIVAVKGLGGFQLACDATDEAAVARLRERKNRWGKPLAVMAPSLEAAREYCEMSAEEETLLTSPAAPIVLLRLLDGVAQATPALAPSLTPGLRELGVMLPYTPLHHLLLDAFGGPLVMTSGNRSEEPIATGNAEALARLADIADAFLLHDRDIYTRYDDSVLRHTPGVGVEFIRRARGFAPFPLEAPFTADVDIMATGPEQKNTFCLLTGSHAFVSQHIGDMENAETLESFEHTVELYERLFRVRPRIVAYDLHPEYLSTKHALSLGLPSVGVQHHHAHIASVTAEHGVAGRVLGVALDGTGYGTDGTIWGGEWLAADWAGFERVAHLRQLPLPGGAAAIRRPARMALGALAECGLLDHPGAGPFYERLSEGEESTVLAMIEHGINTPRTSSMGRLFDAVASLAGVRDDALYEGQAAIELEAVADMTAEGAYAFEIVIRDSGAPLVVDCAPVLAAVLDDIVYRTPASVISARFHRAVTAAVIDTCARLAPEFGLAHVALAGGVFMNRLVVRGVADGVREAGLTPLTHLRLPANDGGIAFGQAVVAWARRHEA
ncbi:MAG: carbamoyltransferase HypF [Coriobacteriia bacterium]|nr:carbamoyltransferase HypF [Coriobacteriia bacterium]